MTVSFNRVPPVWTQTRFNSFLSDVESWINGFTASGTFTSPYTYLIGYDGTDYYAANAYQIVYGGASDAGGVDGGDCTAVFQAVLTAVETAGKGKVCLKSGTYSVTGLSGDLSNFMLQGEGTGASTIMLADGADTDLLTIGTAGELTNTVTLKDVTLDGNKTNNSSGNVLVLNSVYRSVLDNIEVFNGAENGLKTWGESGFATYDLLADKCKFSYNTKSGVYIAWQSDALYQQCIIGQNGPADNTTAGMYIGNVGSIFANNNHVWGNYNGIFGTGSNKLSITGNFLEDNTHDGADFYDCDNFGVSNNYFWQNDNFGLRVRSCSKVNYDWFTNQYLSNGGTKFFDSSTFTRYRGVAENVDFADTVAHLIHTTPNRLYVSCNAGEWMASGWIEDGTNFRLYPVKYDGTHAQASDGVDVYYDVAYEE